MDSNGLEHGVDARRSRVRLVAVCFAAMLVAACAAPGAVATPSPAATASSGTASTDVSPGPSASETATGPTCGTEPIELSALFETGFPRAFDLADEFARQHPNVTLDISQDQFANMNASIPRILAGDSPPDIVQYALSRQNVKDGLLTNLDEYSSTFGWGDWLGGQFAQLSSTPDGKLGSGSLYSFPLGFTLTGVFYNKDQATQIGMTEPPATLAEFEDLLAKAKAGGLTPIMEWNATASGGGLAFPLQQLMAAVGPVEPINEWIFQAPRATIDTAVNLEAAQHLQQWIEAGYFPEDVNAIQYTDAAGRFGKGEGVFTFNGDWQNAGYDTDLGENVGFFVFPSSETGGPGAAMSGPLGYSIPANAAHPDCAAFFFQWVATNEKAREINVTVGGGAPVGPTDLPIPEAPEGSVTQATIAAGSEVAKDNGFMGFIANATTSIFPQGWTPELQKMVGGQQDAAGLLKAVQAEYERGVAEGG
jgi:raffinose/stachyose/melibiose transport system substrate-binding protein